MWRSLDPESTFLICILKSPYYMDTELNFIRITLYYRVLSKMCSLTDVISSEEYVTSICS